MSGWRQQAWVWLTPATCRRASERQHRIWARITDEVDRPGPQARFNSVWARSLSHAPSTCSKGLARQWSRSVHRSVHDDSDRTSISSARTTTSPASSSSKSGCGPRPWRGWLGSRTRWSSCAGPATTRRWAGWQPGPATATKRTSTASSESSQSVRRDNTSPSQTVTQTSNSYKTISRSPP